MEIFGQRLKQIRKEKGITQSDLGKAVGVSKPEICFYENGSRNPSLNNLIELADYLKIDVAWLLGREVRLDKNNELTCLSDKELELINILRKHKKLYKELINNPAEMINKINRDINN